MTDSPLLPFLVVGALVFGMGNGIGDPLALPSTPQPSTPQSSTPQHSAPSPQPTPPSTAGAYNNGLIGQMIYEMSYEGGLSPNTLNQANLTLQHCQAIKFSDKRCS